MNIHLIKLTESENVFCDFHYPATKLYLNKMAVKKIMSEKWSISIDLSEMNLLHRKKAGN